jgi:hypothetical protein
VRSLVEWARKRKQAASKGDDLQLTASALAVLKPDYSGRSALQAHSGGALLGVQLGKGAHVRLSMLRADYFREDYRRTCTLKTNEPAKLKTIGIKEHRHETYAEHSAAQKELAVG